MRAPASLFLALLFACVSEPSYEGRACGELAPCPEGYRCGADQTCTKSEETGDASARDVVIANDATEPFDGGPNSDASDGDAVVGMDSETPVPSGPHARTLSGAGRARGGSMTLDVEIGHPIEQKKASSGSLELKGTLVPR